jgi:proline dehydrogenase
LKRAPATLKLEIQAARKMGYNLGIKLIRGAYMDEERKLATKLNYPSPVWDKIDETHNCYN